MRIPKTKGQGPVNEEDLAHVLILSSQSSSATKTSKKKYLSSGNECKITSHRKKAHLFMQPFDRKKGRVDKFKFCPTATPVVICEIEHKGLMQKESILGTRAYTQLKS